jgi:hypothetical protein
MAKRLYGVDPIERFNQKYIVNEENGCWEWQGTISKKGYGTIHINNKEIKAYRFAYEYFIGPIDNKLMICHNCHNRKCCNPNHLRQDTNRSNMIDMVHQGNQSHQKLSVEEVIQIKKELKNYYRGMIKDLAHFYKVDPETIGAIKRGTSWSHVKID